MTYPTKIRVLNLQLCLNDLERASTIFSSMRNKFILVGVKGVMKFIASIKERKSYFKSSYLDVKITTRDK